MAATESPPSTRVTVPFVVTSASIYAFALMHGIPRGDAVGGTVGYRTNPLLKLNSFLHALLRPCA